MSLRFEFTSTQPVLFPEFSETQALRQVLVGLFPITFEMVNRSARNSCQLDSTFDDSFKQKLEVHGCEPCSVRLPPGFDSEYKYDMAFKIGWQTVVFEIEKADHQKFLFDLLKAHIYLNSTADFVVLVVPTERGRQRSINSFFRIAQQRLEQCRQVGMLSEKASRRILLVGYDQKYQGRVFDQRVRDEIHSQCASFWIQNPLGAIARAATRTRSTRTQERFL